MGAKLKNFDILKANLNRIPEKAAKKFEKDANEISEFMAQSLRNNMSENDHTLQDLAEMGHPYGKKPNPDRQPIPHPAYIIHTQSVDHSKVLVTKVHSHTSITKKRVIMAAFVRESEIPHIKWLVHGTSRMIARPVFTTTFQQIKNELHQRIFKSLMEAFKQ